MSTFASLMALSATQTKEQESLVESTLRDRQRKEALKRKQQEEKEAKEREQEKQRRIKMFEDQKRDEERRKRQEEAKKAQELAFKRREEEEKNRLLYGPKKAAKLASTSSGSPSSSDPRNKGRRRSPDDDGDGPIPLTREELRERKMKMEMNRLYGGASKKGTPSHHGGTHRAGKRLPGGAVDITTSSTSASQSSGDHRSVRDRLASLPNTLVKLNQNKRDTRTIDEILQDRAKAKEAKTLEGDQALVFDDWFGTKKKEKEKEVVKPLASRMPSTGPSSGANTPSQSAPTSHLASSQKKVVPPSKPLPSFKPTATTKAAPNGSSQSRGYAAPSRPDKVSDKAKSTGISKSNKPSHYDHHSSSSGKFASSTSSKKRARSYSRSESPPPKRKQRSFIEDDDDMDVSTEIWKMFGKNRNAYVSRDVLSDDEDMEADARALEQEEMRSYRIAQREEQAALEEERRHEEEKRRRKKLATGRGA